jgi:hypothetical protein
MRFTPKVAVPLDAWSPIVGLGRLPGDTLVSEIEARHGIDLHARGDMHLETLLKRRGFDSLNQLLTAHRGELYHHPRQRHVFLSFHRANLRQVGGFRLMMANPHVCLDLFDGSLSVPIKSERGSYVRKRLREKIEAVDIVVCLIGNGTAWREWVDFEILTAYQQRKGICGVRLKGSRGRVPPLLKEIEAPVVSWSPRAITAAIECAAAKRS